MEIVQSTKQKLIVAKERVCEVGSAAGFYAAADEMRPPNVHDFYADEMRPPTVHDFYADEMRPPNIPG